MSYYTKFGTLIGGDISTEDYKGDLSKYATLDQLKNEIDNLLNITSVDENEVVIFQDKQGRLKTSNIKLPDVVVRNSDGNVDMKLKKIIYLENPTDENDAATKKYVDYQESKYVSVYGGIMRAFLNMSNNGITNLRTPENDFDAVNKKYVDDKEVPIKNEITKLNAEFLGHVNTFLSFRRNINNLKNDFFGNPSNVDITLANISIKLSAITDLIENKIPHKQIENIVYVVASGSNTWTQQNKSIKHTAKVTGLLWLFLLILLIILLIFLIFFCCGCLDCCKCCRIFKHYRKEKFCYVTWYFIKRGCCSFFFCKSSSKRGTCFCGHHTGTRCGGCLSCRKACTCGWRCNCKGMDTSCCGYCFCICCVTARREEEDPLTVCIENKDQICKPAAGKVTISCSVDGYVPGSIKVEWTGPKENKLRDKAKYEITPYSEETGKSFLTILAFSNSDSGWFTCQAMDGEGILVTESINITAHDNERMADRTGPPAIHLGTQNRVESKTASKKTSDRHQPSPPVAEVTQDIPKRRPQPPPPENIYIKDPNKRETSTNFDDKQGLPTEQPRSSRLPPLTLKQPTVEEEDAPEEPKKKRKKKKKNGQMNEENQKEEMIQLKSKEKALTEDQSDGD